MKTIATAIIKGTYGDELAKVQLRTSGCRKGTYRCIGAGYAGRVAYRSAEAAKASVERHALFLDWAA